MKIYTRYTGFLPLKGCYC